MTTTFFHPPGATTLVTPPMRLWHTYGERALDYGGAMLLDGKPGTGKTNLVTTWMATLPLPGVRLQLDTGASTGSVVDQLLDELGVPHNPRERLVNRRKRALQLWLAVNPCVVVIDEAQSLGPAAFNQIRTLHDHPKARWTLVMVGAGLRARLARDPAMLRRFHYKVTLSPLEGAELIDQLRRYHPLFTNADPALLHELDAMLEPSGARGTLAAWAQIADWAVHEVGRHHHATGVQLTTLEPGIARRVIAHVLGV